jgi:uncharacterized protein
MRHAAPQMICADLQVRSRKAAMIGDELPSSAAMTGLHALAELTLLTLAVAMIPAACAGGSTDEKPVPVLIGWVSDSANILPISDQEHLSDLLRHYQQETHHQIAVLTVASPDGEPGEKFSLRTAKAWGLGSKGIDDGILVTLSMKDRLARVEPGKGMQNFISDSDARLAIDTEISPAFAKGDFAQGLEPGPTRLMDKARRFIVSANVATLNPVWNVMASNTRL